MTMLALRTADFAPRHRAAQFQAAAAAMCKLDIVPEADSEYRTETRIGVLPGAVIADTTHSACRATRDPRLAAETGDNVLIHIPRSGAFRMKQAGGEEFICGAGDVYIDPTEVPGVATFAPGLTSALYVSIPRSLVAGGRNGADRLLRHRTRLTPQWRLFHDYVLNLHREIPDLSPEYLARSARHVQELALFAEAGTTFNDQVAALRLGLAHRLLRDPAHGRRSISDIALAAGFGDISWFNARFKRVYGMTPSAVRALARTLPPPAGECRIPQDRRSQHG